MERVPTPISPSQNNRLLIVDVVVPDTDWIQDVVGSLDSYPNPGMQKWLPVCFEVELLVFPITRRKVSPVA